MTALPIDSTTPATRLSSDDALYRSRCYGFDVDIDLLDHPDHAVTVREWLDAAAADSINDFDSTGKYEPYDGSPVPVLQGTAKTAVAALRAVPNAASQAKAVTTPTEDAKPKVAFVERYEEVQVDVFKNMSSAWAMRTTLLRMVHVGETGEIYGSVAKFADYLGEKPETLLKWARTDDCPLWVRTDKNGNWVSGYFELKKSHRRPTKDGTGWEVYWALKPRLVNKNEDGTLVDKKADRFVQVMRWWLLEDPADHDGNQYMRRGDVTAQALHVTAALRAWAGSKAGVHKAVRWVATEFGISKATWDRGAAVAEKAGLYLHEGARSGIVAGYRKPLQRPATRRSHETRRPNEKTGYDTTVPVQDETELNAEMPF